MIEDEIKSVVEGLSVNLNAVTSIKFLNDDRLPDYVQGDLQTLKLAFNTLIEFGMRYCNQGQIEISTIHEGYDINDRYVIKYGIHLKLQINKEFDAKIILNLINQTEKNG